MEKGGWVYIMANRYRGGMYVGVTSDLMRRAWQHRDGQGSVHAADFGKTRLVYAERHDEIEPAIAREKLVKKWRREFKFALIEADNPDWRDLWAEWFAEGGVLEPEGKPSPVSSTGRRVGQGVGFACGPTETLNTGFTDPTGLSGDSSRSLRRK